METRTWQMSQSRRQGVLLASFLRTEDEDAILKEVQYIADSLDLTNNSIFLLQDEENADRKILTYNVAGIA